MSTDVEALYELPLEQFTGARDALVKELRAKGDRARADDVKRLRKPSVAAWAINQLARRSPKAIESLLETGEKLRRAHEELLAGGGVEAVHRATAEEAETVEALLADAEEILGDAGTRSTGQLREKIAQTLEATAIDEAARDAVRKGTLERETRRVGFGDLEATFVPAPPEAAEREHERRERTLRLEKEAAELEEEAERLARAAEEAEQEAERARRRADDAARRAEKARAKATGSAG